MAIRPETPWRPGLTEFSRHGGYKEYCLIRQSGHDSQSKGPHYLHWEDAIVGAAIVNGHMSRDQVVEYASGFAGKDPAIMEEAIGRIEGNIMLLRQHGWDVPDHQPETVASAP